jgi:Ca2+-binding EF-hand superfamily protein
MKTRFLLLGLITLSSLQTAIAFGSPDTRVYPGALIRSLDTNKDKQLSIEEMKGQALASKFAEIDTDKNGQLTRKELKAHRKAQRLARAKSL